MSTPLTAAHPRAIRLRPEDNVVIAIDTIPPGGTAAGVTARERMMRGHKMAVAPIARRRAGAQIRPDHRLCDASRSRRASGCTSTMSTMHDFARDYRFAEGAQERRGAAARPARDLRGLSCGPGQDRHAQLHRHPHLGELLGLGRAFIAREVERSGVLDDHPEIDGVVRVRARHRLRASRPTARASRCCAAPNGATRRTPISAAR